MPPETGKKSPAKRKAVFPRVELETATPLAKRTRSNYKEEITASPRSSSSPRVVVTKETKAPAKEILAKGSSAPTRPKRYKMAAHKGSTLMVVSSNSATTSQTEDDLPEIIYPPSVNKKEAQEITVAQVETTQTFAPETAPSVPKLIVNLDAYFEVLSQKTTPTVSASDSGIAFSSQAIPSSSKVKKSKNDLRSLTAMYFSDVLQSRTTSSFDFCFGGFSYFCSF
ncbi:unnamed protein product [Camellia sinensis]